MTLPRLRIETKSGLLSMPIGLGAVPKGDPPRRPAHPLRRRGTCHRSDPLAGPGCRCLCPADPPLGRQLAECRAWLLRRRNAGQVRHRAGNVAADPAGQFASEILGERRCGAAGLV